MCEADAFEVRRIKREGLDLEQKREQFISKVIQEAEEDVAAGNLKTAEEVFQDIESNL